MNQTSAPTVFMVNCQEQHLNGVRNIKNLVKLSEGKVNAFSTSKIAEDFKRKLEDSKPADIILLSGYVSLNVIATSIIVLKHDRLNLMIFDARKREYSHRTLTIAELGVDYVDR